MAKKYYSRSEKEKLAKKLAAVVAVFVIVCTATVVIGHIVDNQKMNTGRRMQRQRQILLRLTV